MNISVSPHTREVWFTDTGKRYIAVLDARINSHTEAESLCHDRHNATLADVSSDAKRMNLSRLLVRAVSLVAK